MENALAFFFSDRLELAREPLLRLGTRCPAVGRRHRIHDRWSAYVRHAGRDDAKAPPILLLHGWMASAGLNWLRSFEPLAARHPVLAPDLPGHGRSGPGGTRDRFEIDESADFAAGLLERVFPDRPAIVVGYSLGGMVAQALWRRHPERVAGLVLAATSAEPVPIARGRHALGSFAALARMTSRAARAASGLPRQAARAADPVVARLLPGLPRSHWAVGEFMHAHWPTVCDAGRAIAHFDTRAWLRELDVPVSVLFTERDSLIPASQQHALVDAVSPIHVARMDAGHLACLRPDFSEALLAGCRAVERALPARRRRRRVRTQ